MNEELFNPKPEKEPRLGKDAMNEKSAAPKTGNRLSTIFLVVLALHIVVIIGIVGFQLLRGKAKNDIAESTEQTSPTTEVAGKTPETAPVEGQPTIDSNAPTVAEQTPAPEVAGQQNAPTGNEPAWGTTTPVTTPVEAAKVQPIQAVRNEVAKSTPAGKTTVSAGAYTVAAGDTLTKIAKKSGVTVKQLREANSLSSDTLKIGQKLNIPTSGKAAVADVAAPAKPEKKNAVAKSEAPKATAGSSVYTVAKGDTLNKIARSYNTTPAKIADLNKITDPSKIKIGMKLKVPAQATASQNVNTSEASSATAPAAQPATQFRAPQNADLAMLREGERK